MTYRLLAAAVNSLYSFWWDVTNDWGLDLLKLPERSLRINAPPRPLVLSALHSRPSSPPTAPSNGSTLDSLRPITNTHANTHPFGLRSTLLYPLPFYPLIIFLNLILRLTWSIKLSSHLHSHSSEGSLVIFWLEMAEILRRWMWVFVRVEWEVVKKTREGRRAARRGNSYSGYEGEEFELLDQANDAFQGR